VALDRIAQFEAATGSIQTLPQRRSLRHEHIIARQLAQSALSKARELAEPPALVRFPAELGLRLSPEAKF
jgi:hypothetical protein